MSGFSTAFSCPSTGWLIWTVQIDDNKSSTRWEWWSYPEVVHSPSWTMHGPPTLWPSSSHKVLAVLPQYARCQTLHLASSRSMCAQNWYRYVNASSMQTKVEVDSWECKIDESPRQEEWRLVLHIFNQAKTDRSEMLLVDQDFIWVCPSRYLSLMVVEDEGVVLVPVPIGASELIVLSYQKRQGSRYYCEIEMYLMKGQKGIGR